MQRRLVRCYYRRMNANTETSKAWREEQRNAGRTPRLVWLDAKEWAIVRGVIDALKKMRGLTEPTEKK